MSSSSYVLDLVQELSDALQTTVVGKPLPPAKTDRILSFFESNVGRVKEHKSSIRYR